MVFILSTEKIAYLLMHISTNIFVHLRIVALKAMHLQERCMHGIYGHSTLHMQGTFSHWTIPSANITSRQSLKKSEIFFTDNQPNGHQKKQKYHYLWSKQQTDPSANITQGTLNPFRFIPHHNSIDSWLLQRIYTCIVHESCVHYAAYQNVKLSIVYTIHTVYANNIRST